MKYLLALFIVMTHPLDAFAGEGHDAGRDWAEKKGIDDPDDCSGNSASFIAGCEEYAEEQQEEAREEDEDSDD